MHQVFKTIHAYENWRPSCGWKCFIAFSKNYVVRSDIDETGRENEWNMNNSFGNSDKKSLIKKVRFYCGTKWISFGSHGNFYAPVCRKYTHNHIDVENFCKLAANINFSFFFFNTNDCVAKDCVVISCLCSIAIFWSHN